MCLVLVIASFLYIVNRENSSGGEGEDGRMWKIKGYEQVGGRMVMMMCAFVWEEIMGLLFEALAEILIDIPLMCI